MSSLAIDLTKIAASLPRSSHSVSVIAGTAYIYGGEINPREPVDGDVHAVELASGAYRRISASGQTPEPRVGHVARVIDGKIYVFGGRGGPAMTPLDEAGAVHVFDPSASSWTTLSTSSTSYPCARSYHCATNSGQQLIVHAGCGDASTGRLRDTWTFDVSTSEWTQLPDAPGDPRGGTSITVLDGRLWRFGGFNGKTEVGGTIDYLDITTPQSSWNSCSFGETAGHGRDGGAAALAPSSTGPEPRSVAGLHALGSQLIVIGGEGQPSITGGHDAAGNFWDDIWSFNPTKEEWTQLAVNGDMEARGWFGSDSVDGESIVVWGGINSKNERLTDGWILTL
ncbi:uncharacterized protein I303_106946 [Kwoniella dejecticola CBS 10117]|uniref:Kelch repeat protein n=1 Tax=Kwoniella dejecticola CBS 10117 TaxID=1296121 RepID=A0A1A5ZYA1_9TREE|nr:uncharacterized protein I303_06348 [Kwoniella dejecticola CBS 10117]OBR82791.1 hypothetical protein I303_06348 [Kwoniella dejecticola CBS 10117]